MTTPTDLRRPWDPQAGEPATSFAGSVCYREQAPGQRSLRAVARQLRKATSLIDRYSSRWQWVARTEAWDAEQARQDAQVRRAAVDEWSTRHADEGRRLQVFAMAALDKHIERDTEGRIVGLHDVALKEALVMLKLGAQLERTAAGAEGEGDLEMEFVMTVAEAMATVFEEVNTLETPEARSQAFQERSLAAVQRLLADGDGAGGSAGPR